MDISLLICNSGAAARCADIIMSTDFGRLYFPMREMLEDEIARACEVGDIHYAADADEIVGVLWSQQTGMFNTFPYLHIIAVSEDVRGSGIGSVLMDFFERRALGDRMRTRAFLLTKANNDRAQKFYERRGYRRLCEIDGLFRRNTAELLYMKDLRK